jgi:hypothetical protein
MEAYAGMSAGRSYKMSVNFCLISLGHIAEHGTYQKHIRRTELGLAILFRDNKQRTT